MSTFLYFVSAACFVAIFFALLYMPAAGALFFIPALLIAIISMASGKIIELLQSIAIKQGAINAKPAPSQPKAEKPFWKKPGDLS